MADLCRRFELPADGGCHRYAGYSGLYLGQTGIRPEPETVYAQRMRFGSRIHHFIAVGDLCLHARHCQNLIFKLKKTGATKRLFF